jgi:Zn-finger nucleic acid-binding protein
MTLSCPKCGLTLATRGVPIEYCPRCIARRRQPVPMVAETLSRPRAEPAPNATAPEAIAKRTAEILRQRSST